MITQIIGKGFLGPDINQPCSKKMMFIGENRTGKTTRTNIIHLALNGFVSTGHKTYKKASDILNQYAKGDTLTCAIVIDDTEFEYHIYKKASGSVSKRYRIDKAKHSEKEFMAELVKSGDPRIIDLPDFIGMSDAKKIDVLFKLYPADVDIKKINRDIGKKEIQKNNFAATIKTKKAVIKENTMAKNGIDLPAGTLAEIQAEIETVTKRVLLAQDSLKNVEIEAAKKEVIGNSQGEFNKIMNDNTVNFEPPENQDMPGFDSEPMPLTEVLNFGNNPEQSIQKIIDCMNESGCSMCTGLMVAKIELRKFKCLT